MPRTVFTPAYAILIAVLKETRLRAGVGQVELAQRMGKAQSFVSRTETGERRIDVIEVYAIARALGVDPLAVFREVLRRLPRDVAV